MCDIESERKMIVTINQPNEHVDNNTNNLGRRKEGRGRTQGEGTEGGLGDSARGQIRCGFAWGYMHKVRKIRR